MGLFSYFRNRRRRESALADSATEASFGAALAGVDQSHVDPQQLAGLGDLGTMISQAMAQGNVQISSSEHVVDLRGSDLRDDILAALAQHGIDASSGEGTQIDASSVPGLQEEILAALSRAGLDVGAVGGMPGIAPAEASEPEPVDPSIPQIRNPFDRN